MLFGPVALALALATSPDTLPTGTNPAAATDAYLDADARQLVHRIRERSESLGREITAYEVVGRQRITVQLKAMRRDRSLYRSETAARILWRREGTGRVEVLGAREVVPVAKPSPETPGDPLDEAANLAFDPADEVLFGGLRSGQHALFGDPVAVGSEADYRFATGDTVGIRLAGGRLVRLVELRVIPRRSEGRLLRGSLWVDLDTDTPVRAVYQLARPLNLIRDVPTAHGVPKWLRPIEAEMRYLSLDYALWDGRWWLPRLIAFDGEARAARKVEVRVRLERAYEGFRVEAAGTDRLAFDAPAGDTVEQRANRRSRVRQHCAGGACWRYVGIVRPDSVLLHSGDLPTALDGADLALISEGELRELASVLQARLPGGALWLPPQVEWSYLRPDLVRYNRVEGLALGARVDVDVGALRGDATAWLGTADRQLGGELGLMRPRFSSRQRLALYRRLSAVDPNLHPLGLGSSLSAFLFGRDDDGYYRAVGLELTGVPTDAEGWAYGWRLFAERQTSVDKSTDLSLPRLLDGDRAFAENIAADRADQVGASLSLRVDRAGHPAALRWGGGTEVTASAGTFRFVRPTAAAYLSVPVSARTLAALEVAGGTTLGKAPVQGLWYLGGPATVRGYGGEAREHGEAFWRGRAELGRGIPAARLMAFADAGWVGPRRDLSTDPLLLSAGVGASFLDGLVRLDLARALRDLPTTPGDDRGWRLDVYLDAIF